MVKFEDPRSYEEALAVLAGLANLANLANLAPSVPGDPALRDGGDATRLHLAEARYRALVEQIPAVTFIASLVGGINDIYVSPQIESLLGFTQEEWISDPVLWFRQLHAEDREILSREFALACSTGNPLSGVCRAYARDGRMVWVHGEARFVRDASGRPLFLQGIAFDVTEQQQSALTREQLAYERAMRAKADRERLRLEQLFEGLPAAVTILRGRERIVEFMNSRSRELGCEVVGRPFGEAFPHDTAEIAALLDHVYTTGEQVEVREWTATHAAWSSERVFHRVFQPLRDDIGAVNGILVHAVEVTEQVRARQERERIVEELQRTLRYNELFAGMLGHDLRNPLGAIMSGAQLALRRSPPEELIKPLRRIVSSGERMSRMIEQLLDFTRIRVGRGIELQPASVNLRDLCQKIIEETEVADPAWTIELEITGNPIGTWDDDRLLQVLSNLVSNGVRHGDRSAPLRLKIDGTSAGFVTLSVNNRGAIPTELMSDLFDPFRGTRHRRDRARGLGLGLYITRQIVLAHDGTIDVTSSDEAGTTFIISLPREVPHLHPSTPAPEPR